MDETPKDNGIPEKPLMDTTPGPVEESPPTESRMRSFLVRTLRWLLAFLVVLSLGVLLAIFLFYRPATNQLKEAQQELTQMQEQAKTDLDQANQQIVELEQRIQSLTPLETKNQELQTDLDNTWLHVHILSARSDVAAAQLALAQDDASRARIALSKTDATLKDLSALLDADRQKTVVDMQERLALALKGIGENTNAAVSDLNVLATDLLELENAFFARP